MSTSRGPLSTGPTKRLRQLLRWLRVLPVHPQWLSLRRGKNRHKQIARRISGSVLDVGCGQGEIREFIPAGAAYLGMDYPATALEWYDERPQVLGDAHQLPFSSNSFDTVLCLDVIEHLNHAPICVAEISRVLRPGGRVLLGVPFLYPIHDQPRDFQRWTTHGLVQLLEENKFSSIEVTENARDIESSAQAHCIAVAAAWLGLSRRYRLGYLLAPVIAIYVTVQNCLAWLLSAVFPNMKMMPAGYLASAQRWANDDSREVSPSQPLEGTTKSPLEPQ